jgi:hypothetical protein
MLAYMSLLSHALQLSFSVPSKALEDSAKGLRQQSKYTHLQDAVKLTLAGLHHHLPQQFYQGH